MVGSRAALGALCAVALLAACAVAQDPAAAGAQPTLLPADTQTGPGTPPEEVTSFEELPVLKELLKQVALVSDDYSIE